MRRRSVALPFRASAVTDVPVGELFVRLLKPEPPFAPLTPVAVVTVHAQARNALLARATPLGNGSTSSTASASAFAEDSLSWRLLDLTSDAAVIPSQTVRHTNPTRGAG